MKYILCFGDSNTYGYDTAGGGRFPWGVRWTSRVQEALGDGYRVIEEGMGGRTTVWDDPIDQVPSADRCLLTCLASHQPLDLVIIMLGTNDLKLRFGLEAADIAAGAQVLVRKTKEYLEKVQDIKARILLVSPIEVDERIRDKPYGIHMGGADAARRSRELPRFFQEVARVNQCDFLAASDYANPCVEDWMHLDAEGHRKLADGITDKIREILE